MSERDKLVEKLNSEAAFVAAQNSYGEDTLAPLLRSAAEEIGAIPESMIEQFCRDLNTAHDEILRAQGIPPERFSAYDWPEWSNPANSIRWAEKLLGKPLSKISLRGERR